MSRRERILVGAMSGTSADGVDVAIVKIGGTGLEMTAHLLLHRNLSYDPIMRERIFQIRQESETGLAELASLGRDISLAYARCVSDALREANVSAAEVIGVAVHGQTLYHAPPNTIQWIDPSLVAAEVGCPVISDFRRADCAVGGQGAPLVPFADYILFRSPHVDRIVVNIGGIANVTCLKRGAVPADLLAWDTGPGNCISDHLMRKHHPDGAGVDINGELASQGCISRPLADVFVDNEYFSKIGPKSTDGPTMIRLYEIALTSIGENISLPDQLATACWLTVHQIRRAALAWGGQFSGEWIVSGGGTKNRALMGLFEREVAADWKTTDEFGIPSEAKEAVGFALLGAATLDNVPSNVPSATGAKRAVVLGSITPKP